MNEHIITYTNKASDMIWFTFKHGLRMNVMRILYSSLILGTAVHLFVRVKPAFSFTKLAFILGVCAALALFFLVNHHLIL